VWGTRRCEMGFGAGVAGLCPLLDGKGAAWERFRATDPRLCVAILEGVRK